MCYLKRPNASGLLLIEKGVLKTPVSKLLVIHSVECTHHLQASDEAP